MTIRRLGKRETELGLCGHWRLSSFTWATPTPKGWHRFKLYDARHGRFRREAFWLWYDGHRFTKTHPMPMLRGRYPELCDWAQRLIVDHVVVKQLDEQGEAS